MSLPPPQPSYPPPYQPNPGVQPAYPAQPGFPPPAPFPAGTAPAPFPAGMAAAPLRAGIPPKPSRRPSLLQVIGAQAALWPLALIVFIVLWRPMEKWLSGAFEDHGGASLATRIRVTDWVLFALPFIVGGIAAAAFLRPGIARVAIAAAIAVVVPLISEFGLVALFDNLDVRHLTIYYLAYALTATAFGLAWLVLRGRPPARVTIAFAVLPLNWLLLFAHNKLIRVEGVQKVLHTDVDYGLFSGLLLFFFTAVSLAIPLWLAAIGRSDPAPRPVTGPWTPTPAGWPAPAPALAGWPGQGAPAWNPGQPGPGSPGSGYPAPGNPAPAQPGYPAPGQPAPGYPAPGQPGPGGLPALPLDPPANR